METSSFLLAAMLALYMMPTALATFKCYQCSNIPGYDESSPCNQENAKSITCDIALHDRCMTLRGIMTVPGRVSFPITIKNCTISFFCKPGSIFNMCHVLNVSTAGMLSKCNIDCCEGSYCNTAIGISTSAVTSFVAVLMAVFQNLLPRA